MAQGTLETYRTTTTTTKGDNTKAEEQSKIKPKDADPYRIMFTYNNFFSKNKPNKDKAKNKAVNVNLENLTHFCTCECMLCLKSVKMRK